MDFGIIAFFNPITECSYYIWPAEQSDCEIIYGGAEAVKGNGYRHTHDLLLRNTRHKGKKNPFLLMFWEDFNLWFRKGVDIFLLLVTQPWSPKTECQCSTRLLQPLLQPSCPWGTTIPDMFWCKPWLRNAWWQEQFHLPGIEKTPKNRKRGKFYEHPRANPVLGLLK